MPDAPVVSSLTIREFGIGGWGDATPNENDTQWAHLERSYTIGNTSAVTGIYLGTANSIIYAGTGGIADPGHIVGTIGWAKNNASGQTVHLAIGTEGKFQNLAGTTTFAVPLEANFQAAAGAVTNLYGVNSTVASNVVTITHWHAFHAQAPGNAGGTITNAIAFWVTPPTTGTVTNFTGVHIPNCTISTGATLGMLSDIDTGTGTRFNVYAIGTAPNFFEGEVRIGTGTSGGFGAALVVRGSIALYEGDAAPTETALVAKLYVDSADGDLKVKFADGVTKTLATDT